MQTHGNVLVDAGDVLRRFRARRVVARPLDALLVEVRHGAILPIRKQFPARGLLQEHAALHAVERGAVHVPNVVEQLRIVVEHRESKVDVLLDDLARVRVGLRLGVPSGAERDRSLL